MRSGLPLRRSTRSRLIATVGVVAVAGVAFSSCGDPGPLEQAITPTQLEQLDTALVARISATDGADLTADDRNARVKLLYQACKPLDSTQPLLAAVAAVCRPTQITEKLGVVLPERCAKPAAICVRALDRIAEANDQLAEATRALDDQTRIATEDLHCRNALYTTDTQHTAYANLSAAYRVLALGITQDDEEIATLGRNRIQDALTQLRPVGTVAQRTKTLRDACKLPG